MVKDMDKDRLYWMEENRPCEVQGELLVSVRDNEEARLILGLELGREYTTDDVFYAMSFRTEQAYTRGASLAEVYRIQSCEHRLFYYDPLVTEGSVVIPRWPSVPVA